MPKYHFEESGTYWATVVIEADSLDDAKEQMYALPLHKWNFVEHDCSEGDSWELYE